MTKIIDNGDEYAIVRDVYDGHILTCDACGLPFVPNEWYDRHECDPDKVYHEECCPEPKCKNKRTLRLLKPTGMVEYSGPFSSDDNDTEE